ncbi:MAG: sensor histidine kinase [Spirochaetales bacterium]|nr:sensor histidine kinase [Spirochaetales bacterium]
MTIVIYSIKKNDLTIHYMKISSLRHITKTTFIQFVFLFINFLMALYLSNILTKTTDLICYKDDARDFLELIQFIPINPDFVKTGTFLLFFLILILSIARNYYNKYLTVTHHTQLIILDIIVCTIIMYMLNMSNKEILLIPIMNILIFLHVRQRKIVLTTFVVALYILLDSDFLSIPFNMIPITEYIEYQSEVIRLSMYGVKSILNSLSYISFIFFILFDIQYKIEENKRVKELNTALEKSLKNLEIVNTQLVEYSHKSEELARVKERNRLAREIHDTVGHTLVGIELGLKACRNIPQDSPHLLLKQIDTISELATKGSKDIRLSLKALKPDALQRYALIPALKSMIDQINNCGEIHCNLIINGNIPRLIAQQEELIYRIVQESITNSIKHGESTSININIVFSETNAHIDILDNGKGCNIVNEGFGIKHLKEGIEFYKGKYQIVKPLTNGFQVIISLPLNIR